MSLTMFVPSRGRPENVARLLEACKSTLALTSTRIVIGVGNDDPRRDDYIDAIINANCPNGLGIPFPALAPEHAGCVFPLNLMWRMGGAPGATHVGFMGDDVLPETYGWDHTLTMTHEPEALVRYPNDGLRPDIPTAVVMDARIPALLGYMAPPVFRHLFIDVVWRDWGQELGSLVYRQDVMLRHMHPAAGHGVMDESYRQNNSADTIGRDGAAYENYRHGPQFQADIAKLRTLCES